MALADYTYSISTDFPNQAVSPDKFQAEIQASAIVTAIDHIDVGGDSCVVWMKDTLSPGDEAILDGLVAAHDGVPPDDPGLPVALSGESRGQDGTLLVGGQPLTLGQLSFKRTDDGTEQMNVDGTPAGAVTEIWDGDGSYWTPSGEGSATTESAHEGTYGWDTGVTSKDSTTLWTNSVDIDVSGYSQISFWMEPKAFPSGSKLELRWQTVGGSDRGVKLDAAGYVTNYDLDVWQKVTIPMEDFSIGSNNVGRLRLTYAKEAGIRFWFDEFEFTTSGGDGPFTFRLAAPDATEVYHVSMIVLLLSGTSSGWDDDTFANITALTNGLLLRHRRISDGEVLWSFNSKDNVDLFGRYHPQDDITFANSTLLVGFMVKPGKASVVVTDDEVLEFVVRDDLSSISQARAFVHYGREVVPT